MHGRTSVPLLALALASVAQPSAAQDANSCVDEVQRLSEAFSLMGTNGQQGPASGEQPTGGAETQAATGPIAQEPSARKGSSLSDEQRKQVSDLLQQARTAGEQGDGERCLQSLNEARVVLRQAGIGSVLPGSAVDARLARGSGGSYLPGEPDSTSAIGRGPGGVADPGSSDVGTTGGTAATDGRTTAPTTGSPADNSTGARTPGATSGGAVGGGGTGGTTTGGGTR